MSVATIAEILSDLERERAVLALRSSEPGLQGQERYDRWRDTMIEAFERLQVGQPLWVVPPHAQSMYCQLRHGPCSLTELERGPYAVWVDGRRLPLVEFIGAVGSGVIVDPPGGP